MPQTKAGVLNAMADTIAKEIRDKQCTGGGDGSPIDLNRLEEILGDLDNIDFVETFRKALNKKSNIKP